MNISAFDNPIFTRESRSRFRAPRAFALLLLYAALLALVTVFLYDATFGSPQIGAISYAGPNGFGRQFAQPTPATLGRELFFKLALAQLAAWMLLAPALAATALSGERERGLLKSVQLSHLAPRQICLGKLAAVLSQVALLFPITLPMFATCFLLGGVAPSELFIALALQLCAAFFGASLGLFFSARARRAQSSLASALVMTGAIAFLTYSAFGEWRSGAPMFGLPAPPTWKIINALGTFFGPQNALEMLKIGALRQSGLIFTPTGPVFVGTTPATAPPVSFFDSVPPWAWTCGMQLLTGAILLVFATRALRRPMPELTPDDRRWTDFARRALVNWQRDQEARRVAMLAQREQMRAARLSDNAARAGAALLYELPLHHFVNFRDPMLRREVRGKFRWRRASLWVALGQLLALLVLLAFYAFLIFAVFFPSERFRTFSSSISFLLISSMAACAVMGASTLTRERESGTWEGLQLSLLTPLQIVRAKVTAPLIACFYYAMPLWIVLPFYLQWTGIDTNANRYYYGGGEGFWNNGVPASQALATLCVVALAALFCSSVGLLLSALCRKTIAAIGGTLLALVAFYLALPNVYDAAMTYLLHYSGYDFYPVPLPYSAANPNLMIYNPRDFLITTSSYLQPFATLDALGTPDAARVLAIHATIVVSLCAIILLAASRAVARRGTEIR